MYMTSSSIYFFSPPQFFQDTSVNRTVFLLLPSLLWLCLLVCVPAAQADDASISIEYVQNATTPAALVHITLPRDYHAYAHRPGDTGKPTELLVSSAPGTFLPVWYPEGTQEPDSFDSSLTVSIYHENVTLAVDLDGIQPGHPLNARLEMLLCSKKNCLPLSQSFTLTLPEGILPSLPPEWQHLLASAPQTPEASHDDAPAATLPQTLHSEGTLAKLLRSPLGATSPKAPNFEAPAPLPPAQQQPVPFAWEELMPRYFQSALEVSSLSKALLLGLCAGLLLNFMPCVLPVLTFKLSSLLHIRGAGRIRQKRHFRRHALFFVMGVFCFFALLAVLLSAGGLFWGELFQRPSMVLALLIFLFLLSMSALGLFHLPIIDIATHDDDAPDLSAFLSGMTATLLATPCSGPLLGGVLGWAFTQPGSVMITVLMSVALGMSAPYILFAMRPSLLSLLPRPGAWMVVLERLIGFLLLGTSIYLFFLLPSRQHPGVLAMLLFLAFLGWIWGYFCPVNAPARRRRITGPILLLLAGLSIYYSARAVPPPLLRETYSESIFQEALGKEILVVEFTADWCPNCKWVEHSVLTDDTLRRLQTRQGVRFLKADITRPFPEAQRLLRALGSNSIPLTAIFPKGKASWQPLVLRDIYNSDELHQALRLATNTQDTTP